MTYLLLLVVYLISKMDSIIFIRIASHRHTEFGKNEKQQTRSVTRFKESPQSKDILRLIEEYFLSDI